MTSKVWHLSKVDLRILIEVLRASKPVTLLIANRKTK